MFTKKKIDMKLKFQVREGRVFFVNGCASYYELAKQFADSVTDVHWPNKYTEAEKTLKCVMGRNCSDSAYFIGTTSSYLVNTMTPATKDYLLELNSLFKEYYEEFVKQFQIPEVLENGNYTIIEVE